MAQHFLLSATARSLSFAKIMRMSDIGVENVFLRLLLAGYRRQADLPVLRLRDLLCLPPFGRSAALALRGLLPRLLADFRHPVRLA